jgi:hypothetical protein
MRFSEAFYSICEQTSKALVILPGGFKPPHKGHFEALRYLLNRAKTTNAKVFVGRKERDGITQDQAVQIWNIYKKYIPGNIEIVAVTGADKAGRDATPLSMTYDFIEDNKANYAGFYVGAGQEDLARFKGLETNKSKYPNTTIVPIPPQFGRISGTATRSKITGKSADALDFIPDEIREKDLIKTILGI